GLAIQQSSGWRVINSNNGLTSDAVCCVLRDHEGSLWLGTRGSGIQRWLGFEQWESWTKSDGLSNHVVWALRKDDRGRMWVGSNYGLNRLDPRTGEWRSWNVKDGLRGDKVRAVAIDHNGEVWTGAYPGGLARFSGDGKFIASYGKESGLSSEYIWGLLADRENRIWVGANGGVFRSLPPPAVTHRLFLNSWRSLPPILLRPFVSRLLTAEVGFGFRVQMDWRG